MVVEHYKESLFVVNNNIITPRPSHLIPVVYDQIMKERHNRLEFRMEQMMLLAKHEAMVCVIIYNGHQLADKLATC